MGTLVAEVAALGLAVAKTLGRVILRATGTQTITVTDNAGRVDVSNPITVYSF